MYIFLKEYITSSVHFLLNQNEQLSWLDAPVRACVFQRAATRVFSISPKYYRYVYLLIRNKQKDNIYEVR